MAFRVRFRRASAPSPLLAELAVEDEPTLLVAARRAGLPVARACGGDGLCGRCGLRILAGDAALSPETADEREAKERNRVPAEQRLACRARIRGAVDASASYW